LGGVEKCWSTLGLQLIWVRSCGLPLHSRVTVENTQ
jgi:hypothetical protein